MLKIKNLHSATIPFSSFKFPGGEIQVKIDTALTRYRNTPEEATEVRIVADLHSSDDIMELFLATDALKRHEVDKIHLTMPYIPYARQDRVCAYGESLALKVFCDQINAQKYESVTVWDPHSDVATALLDRVEVVPQKDCVQEAYIKYVGMAPRGSLLVSPDAGANKKILQSAKVLGAQIIRADKVRDVYSGNITGTEVYCSDLGSQDLLILDDLCDAGRTFIELAKVLRTKTTGKIKLYVTHGIFSKGLEPFVGVIDSIYCYKAFCTREEYEQMPNKELLNVVYFKGEFA